VKSRLEKKERRRKARLVYKANEKHRKLEDVRLREEERLQRRKGLGVVQKPVKRLESIRDDTRDAAPAAAAEDDDSKKEEKPIDPRNIHGGSVSADKLIRSKMVPGDRMYARCLCIEVYTSFANLIFVFQRTNFGTHREFDAEISSRFDRWREQREAAS
jgi:hypothetical protein